MLIVDTRTLGCGFQNTLSPDPIRVRNRHFEVLKILKAAALPENTVDRAGNAMISIQFNVKHTSTFTIATPTPLSIAMFNSPVLCFDFLLSVSHWLMTELWSSDMCQIATVLNTENTFL